MKQQKLHEVHQKARASLAQPVDVEEFGAKLAVKDRHRLEQQIAALDTKPYPGLGERWRRFACALFTLAPHMPKMTGLHTIQFFIADGKYRKQMFAIHADDNGSLVVYAPNVIEQAIKVGIIKKPTAPDTAYRAADSAEPLSIDLLDGNTPDAEVFYKDMTGWNRKAVRVTLSPVATSSQLQAAEDLCALAALEWLAPK